MICRRVSMIIAKRILGFSFNFVSRTDTYILGLDKIIQEKNSAPQYVIQENEDRRPGDRGAVISHVW